jgi:hypothetical protein
MRSEERAGKRHDLHLDRRELASANGNSNGHHGQTALSVEEPAADGKVSAWEAAWRQRAGSSPIFSRKPTDRIDLDGTLVAPSSATNGNGHTTHWWPVEQ